MKFFQRIAEALFINFLWWIIHTMIMATLFVYLSYMQNTYFYGIPYVLIILTAAIFFYLLWYFGWRIYPSFTWDVIHDKNTYTLTYITRAKAHYTKSIQAIALRKHLNKFKDGELKWSGESSGKPYIVESEDYDLIHESNHDLVKYIVCPKGIIKKYKKMQYTLGVDLYDPHKTANPNNFIYIKRPTKRITLVLRMPVHIPICNVRYIARTKYGEENTFIYKKGKPEEESGYNIYTFTIRRPKLFCEYEICWEWCE